MKGMSTRVERIVEQTIERFSLLQKGDRVVVGLSGGPDSVCLLHALKVKEAALGITVYAAHLNHHLRGLKAREDAKYVLDLCSRMGIRCFIKDENIAAYATENRLGIEEAGRIKRYEYYEEICEQIAANKIALGHHKDDQAETILMRIIRGTGVDGLAAMDYRRDKVIRPLLDLKKDEIVQYCIENRLNPRRDETNEETDYFRNRVRLDLIPCLKEGYNPKIVDALVKLGNIAKEEDDYLQQVSQEHYAELVNKKAEMRSFPSEQLRQLHPAIRARVLRRGVEDLVEEGQTLGYYHLQGIEELLLEKGTGKKVSLSLGLEANVSYDEIRLYKKKNDKSNEFLYTLDFHEKTVIHELGLIVEAIVLPGGDDFRGSGEAMEQVFDYGKVKNHLTVRNRRAGDRMTPLGMTGSKKLKDLFIDLKIDQRERQRIPLICDGEEIIWVAGYRIGEQYKISRDTKKKLLIRITKG